MFQSHDGKSNASRRLNLDICKEPFGTVLLTGQISKGSTQFDNRQSGNICTKALHLWNATSTKKRDKYTAGRVMTGQSGGKKTLGEESSEQKGRRSETERRDDVLNGICRLPSEQAAATDPGSLR